MSNATHRILWTSIALLLVALGALGLTLSLGGVAGTDPGAALLWSGLLRWWRASEPWPTLAVAVGGLLLALLGHRILDRELRPDAGLIAGELALVPTPADPSRADRTRVARWRSDASGAVGTGPVGPAGQIRIGAGVLQRGLVRDLSRDRRIRHARVVLTGTPPRPEVWIRLRVDPGVAMVDLRAEVSEALRRFTVTSGFQPSSVDVTAHVVATDASA